MARPRKNEEGPSAQQRLVQAFWDALEEGPYSTITVRGLASRAKVNHNTFYYYFGNIDDLAVKAYLSMPCDKLIDAFLDMALHSSFKAREMFRYPEMAENYHHVRLLLRHGSEELVKLVREGLLEQFEQRLGITKLSMTPYDIAKMTFIWGGISALIASDEAESLEVYVRLIDDGIGDAGMTLLRRVIAGQLHEGVRLTP